MIRGLLRGLLRCLLRSLIKRLVQPGPRHRHRPENRPPFVHGFLPFAGRHRVGDDAAADLDVHNAVFNQRGADGDGGVHIAVPTDVTNRAGVNAALVRFNILDDFHRPNLGRAGQRAGRKGRFEYIDGIEPLAKLPGDIGDNVHHMRILFDSHFVGDLDRANARHPADVVAPKINQHQVFGQLLRVGQQLDRQCRVLLVVFTAPASAGDRAHRDLPLLQPHQIFG